MAPAGTADTRRYGRHAGLVSAGIAAAGLLLYGFFALASHTLSAGDYGEIVVLWLIVFATVSILFRPIEQLLAREIAAAIGHGESGSAAMRSAALILFALIAVFLVLVFAFAGPLRDDLFSGDSFLPWCLIGGVVTFGGDYYLRGVLAGHGRFDIYSAQLVTESAVLVGAGVLATIGVTNGLHAFAAAIAIAPLLGLAVAAIVAISLRRTATRPQASAPPVAGGLARHGGFAGAVLLIMLSEQVLINSGPLFVRAAEGTAAAGFVFNLLMVARAPAALFQGIAASLLPHLADLQARGGAGGDPFAGAVRSTLIGILAFAAATLIGVIAIGPSVMQAVFGDNFDYGRAELAMIAIGMGMLLVAATLTQAALVRGQAPFAAAIWITGALTFIGFNLTGALDPAQRVEVGFAAVTALLVGALIALLRRGAIRPDRLAPGSPDELQARLAAAEEVG